MDCETQFGAILNAETGMHESLDTFIVARETRTPVVSAPVVGRDCPKCGTKNVTAAQECRSCGVLFARFKPGAEERMMSDVQLAGRLELVSMWDTVAEDYQNLDLHQKFVLACDKAGCLPFASHKYANILSVAPEEEIAKKMRKQIVGLASRTLESSTVDKGFSFPLPGFNGLILLMGTVALLVGFGLPQAKDVAAVGAAMVALAIGMRFFLRRPQ